MKLTTMSPLSLWGILIICNVQLSRAEYVSETAYDQQAQNYAQNYAPQQGYQNYYQPAQERQDVLALGLPLGLAAVLGLGGLVAGLTSIQQGASARTSLEDSLTSLEATRATLSTMLATETTAITTAATALTPVTTQVDNICTTIKTLRPITQADGTDANNLIALTAVLNAAKATTC